MKKVVLKIKKNKFFLVGGKRGTGRTIASGDFFHGIDDAYDIALQMRKLYNVNVWQVIQ